MQDLVRIVTLTEAELESVIERAVSKALHGTPTPVSAEDRLLTAEEAAPLLSVRPRWLYRHAKRLPFTRRLSRKALRFSEAGLLKYREAKRQ